MTQKLRFEQLEQFGFGPRVMQKTRLCPWCSSLVTNGADTCPACGKQVSELTLLTWYEQQHIRCVHCATVLSPDAQYCPHCGRRVVPMAVGERP